MSLTDEEEEALKSLLAAMRRADPNNEGYEYAIRKLILVIHRVGSYDKVMKVIDAFGVVGHTLKWVLYGTLGVVILLQTLSGQLKQGLITLLGWAVK